MSRIAYVNGRYVRHSEAAVHIEDRGYQFADGVYEVCEVAKGCIIDMPRHLARLTRSLSELAIAAPMAQDVLSIVIREIVRRNRVTDGLVYLQVTRGVAPRDHVFPPAGTEPALVVTAKKVDTAVSDAKASKGISVISVPDNRWDRVDIKTVGLLPNAMARQKAREQGAYEAWFVDEEGYVTEGGATNAWIVTKDGTLVTRPAEHGILRGITRTGVIDVAAKNGLTVEERRFTIAEAQQAREAFITAATALVMPVVSVDGSVVANGHPGSVTLELRQAFIANAHKTPV